MNTISHRLAFDLSRFIYTMRGASETACACVGEVIFASSGSSSACFAHSAPVTRAPSLFSRTFSEGLWILHACLSVKTLSGV